MKEDVLKIVEFVKSINFKMETLPSPEYPEYVSLPLCVIDSVFSIGVKYGAVKNTVQHFYEYVEKEIGKNPEKNPMSVSEILTLLNGKSEEILANEVYKNKQRTSTTNGILKAVAVTQFLQILKRFGIENLTDMPKIADNAEFENEVKKIKGQGSGVSLSYFYMLAGNNNLVKADRMVVRFLKDRIGRNCNQKECQELLGEAAKELNIFSKVLDFSIWKHESAKSNITESNIQKWKKIK